MDFLKNIKNSKMFSEIDDWDIKAMNFCFKTRVLDIKKGEILLNENSTFENIILVLNGQLRTVINDYYGNTSIISNYFPGDAIGMEEAFSNLSSFPFTIVAVEDTSVLLMNKLRVIKPCDNMCKRHLKLQNNVIQLISQKNIELMEKFNHITKHSTREKVLAYLQSISKKTNSKYFDIPFNRQELADYLSVDRSALSFELSKMQKDGLIDFNKNHFCLK